MKEEKDFIGDISAIRAMMERTSKFLSLSGWAGVMAGIYALAGVWIAVEVLHFNPDQYAYPIIEQDGQLGKLIMLAAIILILAIGTAIGLSTRKAQHRKEAIWNATSRRMVMSMAVPLVTGGLLILIFAANGLLGLVAPLTLIFYGLALYNAGTLTFSEIRILGLSEIILGIVGICFVNYGLVCWAIGFGVLHIVTGVYLYYKYER